jgi:quercetin dioxygenase-like cupin family protein
VTGHDGKGKATFQFDDFLTPFNPFAISSNSEAASNADEPPLGVTLIHRTREYPVKVQGGAEELAPDNVRRGRGEPGVVCQIVDLPPTPSAKSGYLHRNQSLDYGVVLKGSMQILLDDGAEQTLREGDVFVQK